MDPVRFSRLKLMSRSPAHYAAYEQEETASIEKGRALHALVLGGPRVVCYPGAVRRGKEYEAYAEKFSDALILNRSDYASAMGMAEAVKAHPRAMELLQGSPEVELDWSFLGRACQSHIDVVGSDYLTELKSTRNCHPDRFKWQARQLGYHAQLAFYDEAVRFSGSEPRAHYIVAVESSAPFVVTTLRLTDRMLDEGRRLVRLWMERLLACEAAGAWPGYCESTVDLDVPEDDAELTFADEEEAA